MHLSMCHEADSFMYLSTCDEAENSFTPSH